MRILFLAAAIAGCTDGPETFGDDLADRQLPPRGYRDIATWLDAGYYKDWHCEASVHPAAPESPHGPNRICNNEVLQDAREHDGVWPVGSASVKEVFRGSTIVVYAVSRRLDDVPGPDGWYWYEGIGDDVSSIGQDIESCVGCHAGAARDFVFTVVD
jgi:hypothetical protein